LVRRSLKPPSRSETRWKRGSRAEHSDIICHRIRGPRSDIVKIRTPIKLLACALAVLVAAPLADAGTVDKTSYSGPSYCSLNACSIAVAQSVYSDSTNGYDCIGSPGAYQACVVYHSCEADMSGDLLTQGDVQCYSEISVGTAGS